MTRCVLNIAALFVAFAVAAADDAPSVQRAVQPLIDGVPQVAVVRLRELLAETLPADQRRTVTVRLTEALLASGDADGALRVLQDPALGNASDVAFARAQVLAALHRPEEALPLYEQVAADGASPLRADALMGKADALRALGRSEDALTTLRQLRAFPEWSTRATFRAAELLIQQKKTAAAIPLVNAMPTKNAAERKQKRFLRAQIEASTGHSDKALDLFGSILKKPAGATHAMLLGALFAIADLHLRAHTADAGDDVLVDYIDHRPDDSDLPRVFAKLDELYRDERKPGRRDLVRWATDPAQPRRALAQWELARIDLRAGRREDALHGFAQLRESGVKLPELAEAYLEFAQIALTDRRFADANAILNEARALQPPPPLLDRINLLQGQTQYRADQWQEAARTFEHAAHVSRQIAVLGFFNASLAWLQLRDHTRFIADATEVARAGGDENTRGDLALEQGLAQAAQSDGHAAESLQNFVRDFPHHPRVSEALVALAEVAFHASPPRIRDAQRFLARATESHPNAAAAERADYLRIWIADAAPDPNAPGVITLADQFLKKHRASRFAPEVRMKLAEAYFRRQDFANAQTQFELLAQQEPNGRFAEKAQFFAAESALQSMGAESIDRALALLDQVVKRNGELKWAARNEQATLERKVGKAQEALTLYDEVLSGDAKAAEKREALCGKADVTYELASGDPQKYRAAMELYEQLANQADAPAHWRNQALFKAGMCLEKMKDEPHALETFYRVLEQENRPDQPREFFWFYKAGFNAARLLEEQSQWAPAANVYQKLALAGGDRSDEAKARLSRLRLEHFLWEL